VVVKLIYHHFTHVFAGLSNAKACVKMRVEVAIVKNIFKTGKKTRPKTAVKGKRFLCSKCRKRSPKPVKTPAPWYCPNCLKLASTNETGGSET